MKKYFAFVFSFLFILVSVFSFSSFGSVHAQEFKKTVQFTKFPVKIHALDKADNYESDVSYSTNSSSVRYSYSIFGQYLDVLFFSSSPFTLYEQNNLRPDVKPWPYNSTSVSEYPNVYIYSVRFFKDDLIYPTLESLNGKNVSIDSSDSAFAGTFPSFFADVGAPCAALCD